MANQQELNETKDKCLDSLNRVNLLLLKEHDLRREQKLYQQELNKVQGLIASLESGRQNGMYLLAEDSYLKETIKDNEKKIGELDRKLKGQDFLMTEVQQLNSKQHKYVHMISNEFQNSIQQRLSTTRGKVDELKKKIKEISKETTSIEQEYLEGIDDYSLCLKLLEDYQQQNAQLRQEIAQLKINNKK